MGNRGLRFAFFVARAPGRTESPFAIQVEAPEVLVPVVVLDRTHRVWTGKHREELDEEIAGLALRDFRIFEDGVPLRVNTVVGWILSPDSGASEAAACDRVCAR